jgi:hypothetical protein
MRKESCYRRPKECGSRDLRGGGCLPPTATPLTPLPPFLLVLTYLIGEVEGQVLVDDAVRCGEEGENAGDKVALIVGELLPILQ